MKAIGRIELGVSLRKDQTLPHKVINPEILTFHDPVVEERERRARAVVEERERKARTEKNKTGLMGFYNLDPATIAELTYETGILKRREKGIDVPEKSALLTHTDVRFKDGKEVSYTMLVDAHQRVPEELATGLGFEAEYEAARGEYYSDIITDISDKYYDAAREETRMYMAAHEARATGAVALLLHQEESRGADVIPIRPGAMDGAPFGAEEAVS